MRIRLALDRISAKPGLYLRWFRRHSQRTMPNGLALETVEFGAFRLLPLPFKPWRFAEDAQEENWD